ncbi:hypothetical protein HN803_00875 [candidate division WWE3 bacterium]|jgi:hypothetical protein|nr:hypothetical protein [candidate division WWE3 bacterium]MBT7349333.1 hypothetical protein [candidate division WWE3 bacterium]
MEENSTQTKDRLIKYLPILTLMTTILLILLAFSILNFGLSLWRVLIVIAWIAYFMMKRTGHPLLMASATKHFLILIVIMVITFVNLAQGSVIKNSSGKVEDTYSYTVSSEDAKLKGLASVKEWTNGRLQVAYFLMIDDSYPSNYVCKPEATCMENVEYTYGLDLVKNDKGTDEGMLFGVFCNNDLFPHDPFDYDSSIYSRNGCDVDNGALTDTFNASFTSSYESRKEFLEANILNTYDASNYWIILEKTVEGNSTSMSHGVDLEGTLANEPILKSYTLNFEEN